MLYKTVFSYDVNFDYLKMVEEFKNKVDAVLFSAKENALLLIDGKVLVRYGELNPSISLYSNKLEPGWGHPANIFYFDSTVNAFILNLRSTSAIHQFRGILVNQSPAEIQDCVTLSFEFLKVVESRICSIEGTSWKLT